MLYHKVQEVPNEFYYKRNNLTPGERLIKEVQNNDVSRDYSELDDSFTPEEGHKGYTLCLICNLNTCGYDKEFSDYKQTHGINGKAKKIVVNSTSFQNSLSNGGASSIKAVQKDENTSPLIGKIVFFKDSDIESNRFEENISRWMSNFHRKLAKYCIKKPRYSELRPMKYSLT